WSALSTEPLGPRRLTIERRLKQLFILSLWLLAVVLFESVVSHASTPMSRGREPVPSSTSLSMEHSQRHVLWSLCIWAVFSGAIFAVACVPSFRAPWSKTVETTKVASNLLTSAPIVNFTTPYVSFLKLRLAGITGS